VLQRLIQDGPRNDDVFVLLLAITYTVAQLVEALGYQPEVSGFDSRWVNDLILPAAPMTSRSSKPLTEICTTNIC
jgi:hypothetical protein